MYCFISDTDDPFINLAVEEILLKNRTEEFLILSVNKDSLIVGKHQSAQREINTRFVTENNIPVIRRISGGGTVFHDHGNLNFTFIRNSKAGSQIDFPKYTRPVIDFLVNSGIEARFEGKSDIRVQGYKISGNSEHVQRNRVLHHGTLLFSSSLENLRKSLNDHSACYCTRAVMSNPAPVSNIQNISKAFSDISEFRDRLMEFLSGKISDSTQFILPEEEQNAAILLADVKYRKWDWNYAYGPEYEFRKDFMYHGERVTARLYIKGGIIWDCIMESPALPSGIDKKLIGCRHMPEDMTCIFSNEDLKDFDIFDLF
jgi:lipoate-protein ligase A